MIKVKSNNKKVSKLVSELLEIEEDLIDIIGPSFKELIHSGSFFVSLDEETSTEFLKVLSFIVKNPKFVYAIDRSYPDFPTVIFWKNEKEAIIKLGKFKEKTLKLLKKHK